MRIGIIGYGKMGRLIEETAQEGGHTVAAVVDPVWGNEYTKLGTPVYRNVAALHGGPALDVAIEFTRPDQAVDNIRALAALSLPTVVGTTGWYDQLDEVTAVVNQAGSSLLWASNFSLGVNLFYRIVSYAAALIGPYEGYDVAGWEAHHNKKADSPSGTAKTLVNHVLAALPRKTTPVWDTLPRPPAPEELHYPSLRVGATPGIHTLIFDSPADTIELRHTARNREGLVAGALTAATWLVATPRQGVFTFDDVLGPA